MILLDTHVLIWSRQNESPIGPLCRQQIDQALAEADLAVSAYSFWEIAMLGEKGRLTVARDLLSWRNGVLEDGILEIPVNGAIGIRANNLPNFHRDPADRIRSGSDPRNRLQLPPGGHTLRSRKPIGLPPRKGDTGSDCHDPRDASCVPVRLWRSSSSCAGVLRHPEPRALHAGCRPGRSHVLIEGRAGARARRGRSRRCRGSQ